MTVINSSVLVEFLSVIRGDNKYCLVKEPKFFILLNKFSEGLICPLNFFVIKVA